MTSPISPPPLNTRATLIIVMGVSGTGKSTLGAALAKALSMPYVEGDDLHPRSNVSKMAAGQPLTDTDREPWLALIRDTAERITTEQGRSEGRSGVVISCSALKRYYRNILRGKGKQVSHDQEMDGNSAPVHVPGEAMSTYFVFIDGAREILMDRMEKRPGHFMKASMLDSQLRTLEDPTGEEGVVVVSIEDKTEDQVEIAQKALMGLFEFK